MMRCKILLGDDHGVVLEGLRRILDRPGFEVVGAVKDGRALVEAAARLNPDVIIADISMPLLNGVEAARQIQKHDRRVKIVFLTMHPEATFAVEAMRAGGSAYVLKETAGEELLTAIGEVLHGRIYVTPLLAEPVVHALHSRRKSPHQAPDRLTPRQREVLQLLAEGRTPKQISTLLNVSDRTVEFHKYRIMETLGLHTIAELAGYAVKKGIVA
jgi:DNA-binding NarL/FixJ family response regulator